VTQSYRHSRLIRLKRLARLWRSWPTDYRVRLSLVTVACAVMLLTTFITSWPDAPAANAYAARLSPTASCERLASSNPTITNGSSWGRTIMRGHGAPGGWFGVDVCSNGSNSGVSCDSTANGCSPTTDGYGWTFQCPELIVRFSAWAFGDSPGAWGRSGWGNAPDLWLPVNHPSDFVMYRNGSTKAPVPGDILVWGYLDSNGNPWPAGPDGGHSGHIAVVAAVHGGRVTTAEQNVKWSGDDHPSDTLALTKVGSRWILSGSAARATSLPTYRWLGTMGYSRGTYGWLHNVKNDGHFPATGKATAAKSGSAAVAVPQPFPNGLPSLASSPVVTQSGTLADLTWSSRSFFAPSADNSQPQAQVRSLGQPAGGVHLAAGQSAATLTLGDGTRYSYVLGADGNLYAAHTSPDSLGVFWSALGQPPDVHLTSAPVASLFAGGVQVAALGSDGSLWWRAGPPERLGNWFSLGSPSTVRLEGGLALTGAPGTGAPVAFALGVDGKIHMRIWQDATVAADGTQIPGAWSKWLHFAAQSADGQIVGPLVVVPEAPNAHNWVGSWPDSPLNLLALDTNGALWWFRTTSLSHGWSATVTPATPAPLNALLGGVAVEPGAGAASATQPATLQVYAAAHDGSYLATLPLPTASGAVTKPTWTKLASRPVGMAASASSAAVELGPGHSALVASVGDDVVIGGTQAMTTALLPGATRPAAPGSDVVNTWVRAGSAPVAATFSDAFASASLDSRWTRSTSDTRAKVDDAGLILLPGAQEVAALTQAAIPGDTTLSVKVTAPRTLPGTGTVGLVLYQDDSDWLTLTVDHSGAVRLCPMAQGTAQKCLTGKTSASAPAWLRIARKDSTFSGLVSSNGSSWQTVGTWTPLATSATTTAETPTGSLAGTPTVAPSATATSTPGAAANSGESSVAPLAFSSWGVLATGDGSATGWPHLTDFTVTPAQ
jgi:CHAP domain